MWRCEINGGYGRKVISQSTRPKIPIKKKCISWQRTKPFLRHIHWLKIAVFVSCNSFFNGSSVTNVFLINASQKLCVFLISEKWYLSVRQNGWSQRSKIIEIVLNAQEDPRDNFARKMERVGLKRIGEFAWNVSGSSATDTRWIAILAWRDLEIEFPADRPKKGQRKTLYLGQCHGIFGECIKFLKTRILIASLQSASFKDVHEKPRGASGPPRPRTSWAY